MRLQPSHRLIVLTIALVMLIAPLTAFAQTAPEVSLTAEYNIGFDCPASATLSPNQTALWVLMDNCGHGGFNLLGFNVTDGSPIKADDQNFADALTPLTDQWLYSDTRPLGFTPDGSVDVRYNDADTYDALNLRLSLTGDKPTPTELKLLTNEAVHTLFPDYDGYLETITFSTDHTLAVVPDEGKYATSTFHVLDLRTGKERFQLESTTSTDFSRLSFSPDNQHLYVSTLKNPDDTQDNSSTLKVYNLPDGKLLKTYDIPTYINYFSPDGRFVAGLVGGQFDAAMLVTDLETGSTSKPIFTNEPSHPVTECLNNGKKLRGLNYKTSGELPVIDLVWLPDSSGFLTVNSYQGEASGGGSICIFNYSRLRQYKVK